MRARAGAWWTTLLLAGCADGCSSDRLVDLPEQAGDTDAGPDGFASEPIQIVPNREVDILLVVDDSTSMGPAQARLVHSGLTEILEAEGLELDYRIAFTTTDVGNPWCDTATAEHGRFVLSSCRGRLEDFAGNGLTVPDADEIACTAACPYEPEQLDALMKPTATALDPEQRVRPWLESVAGATNLPDGVATQAAFACFAPQGIGGCGFESPLEAMFRALERMQTEGEPEFGFLRPRAAMLVVFVTDAVDCSVQHEEIFEADGAKAFWSEPDAAYPTSAVCWNAGVACSGGPGTYTGCDTSDKASTGVPTSDPDAAVLVPLSRYVDALQAIEADKQLLNPDREVFVSVLAGVPAGYAWGQAEILYADSPDPTFMARFGIGPGCADLESSPPLVALPPVRLRDFAAHFGDRTLYSACDHDYSRAFEALASPHGGGISPACFRHCAADVDPEREGLQPDCIVEQRVYQAPTAAVMPCVTVDGELEQPNDASVVCHAARTDVTQTGDPLDDMSDECIERGDNLEFSIVRREGFPAPGDSSVIATCRVSATPETDCPGWP